ncbi:MAG: hypothetical protein GKR87_11665 [Kiritimatiellae bacterium]|nr:hypothetical protein [Kiritimatiellia bacterium]
MDPSLNVADTNGIIDDVTDDELDGIPNSIATIDAIFGGLPAPKGASSSIGNLVWEDLNADGIYTTNEPGRQNITVILHDGVTSNSIATNTTGVQPVDISLVIWSQGVTSLK